MKLLYNVKLVNANRNETELSVTLAYLILTENVFLVYISHLGIEGEFEHFTKKAISRFSLDLNVSEEKQVYAYGKGRTAYNRSYLDNM